MIQPSKNPTNPPNKKIIAPSIQYNENMFFRFHSVENPTRSLKKKQPTTSLQRCYRVFGPPVFESKAPT